MATRPEALRDAAWDVDHLARRLETSGRLADAMEVFKLAVELFPRSAAAHASLGAAHARRADTTAAVRNFEQALALDPHETRAIELLRRVQDR